VAGLARLVDQAIANITVMDLDPAERDAWIAEIEQAFEEASRVTRPHS
jgi:hypothetical protein